MEVLVIIAVMSILMAVSIDWYVKYQNDRKLTKDINGLLAELQWAREHSISGDGLYGVYIDVNATSYIVFKNLDYGCSYNSQEEKVREVQLDTGIYCSNSSSVNILFERRGYPLNSSCGLGMYTIILKNANNREKKIIITRYGRFKIE